MAKPKRLQVLELKNYGDAWINRLAVVCTTFDRMESDRERDAVLAFMLSRYQHLIPE